MGATAKIHLENYSCLLLRLLNKKELIHHNQLRMLLMLLAKYFSIKRL